MARQVINPKQTKQKAQYRDDKGNNVLFDKNNGYYFSNDKEMDKTVDFFLNKGFKIKGVKKKKSIIEPKKEEPKKEEPNKVIQIKNKNN